MGEGVLDEEKRHGRGVFANMRSMPGGRTDGGGWRWKSGWVLL